MNEAKRDDWDDEEDQPKDDKANDEQEVEVKNEDGKVSVTQRPSRAERRQRRFEETVARHVQEKTSGLEAEVRSLRGLLQSQANQRPAPPPQQHEPEEPWIKKVQDIAERKEQIVRLMYQDGISEQDRQRYRSDWYRLDVDEKRAIMSEAEERASKKFQSSGQQPGYEEQVLRSEFPMVVSNPNALRWAAGQWNALQAEAAASGTSLTIEDQKAIMRKAGEKFGVLRQRAPETPAAIQQRHGAVPSAPAIGATTSYTMTDSDKRLALAWGDVNGMGALDHEKIYAAWYKNVGRYVEKDA
jgi:hypothetical protein